MQPRIVRIEFHCTRIGRARLPHMSLILQHHAEIGLRGNGIGCNFKRFAVQGFGFRQMSFACRDQAKMRIGKCIGWVHRDGRLVSHARTREIVHLLQHNAQIRLRLRIIGA